jgi:NADPH-dependent 2,4-dienoyl-CoA reductase/sulfur reductase-like enzyme
MDYRIEPAKFRKKVMVVGGGLGGMEAARTLAERAHEVSLFEKSDKLGGQWNIVSTYRPELHDLVKYLTRGLEKAGVKVVLNREVTPRLIEEMKPDTVVVATGAKPIVPDEVPGLDGKNVVQATDVLMGKVDVGQKVVVIGGRLVGLDVALFLAERGKDVSVVTRHQIARGIGSTLKLTLMENLIKYGVYIYPDSTLESITENGAYLIWDSGETAVRHAERHELFFLKADTVILAVGSKADNNLGEQLSGFMPEVYTIGDCVEPRDALVAIKEGSAVGRKI